MSGRDAILARIRAAVADAPDPQEPLVDLLIDRLTDYGATVRRIDEHEVTATLTELLPPDSAILAPPGLPRTWLPPGLPLYDPDGTATDLDGVDTVVTTCVLAASRIVASVPEAMARLRPTRSQTWISGPSATSDIELDRVVGVHGPRRLEVLILKD